MSKNRNRGCFPCIYNSLSAEQEGTIHYTLDGSEPSGSSTAYTEPVVLDDSAVIRARFFDESGEVAGEPWVQNFRKIEE